MKLMVINGPNLNRLGKRDPEQYGKGTYEELVDLIQKRCKNSTRAICLQTNSEGKIIDYIQTAADECDGIVINPGAYSHYSYAIMDAIADAGIPVVEVHISKVEQREDFRRKLVTGSVCDRIISGKGFNGYIEAVDYLEESINGNR
jgi:3-dehydroquinate dehydratase-2